MEEVAVFGRHGMFFKFEFPPGPFQRGSLKYVILELIKEKPRHGYEIIRTLEERAHGFYAPSPGAVYPTLQMLEEMGYVTSAQQDGKKLYTITDEGRRFLDERKDLAEDIEDHFRLHWRVESVKELGETMREFARFGQVFGRRMRHADAEKVKRVREVISRSIKEIEAILEEKA